MRFHMMVVKKSAHQIGTDVYRVLLYKIEVVGAAQINVTTNNHGEAIE